jgi:endonuclease IV
MADYSEQITAIKAAIASGSRRIVFHSGGTRREVEYQTLREMIEALEWLLGKQSSSSGNGKKYTIAVL